MKRPALVVLALVALAAAFAAGLLVLGRPGERRSPQPSTSPVASEARSAAEPAPAPGTALPAAEPPAQPTTDGLPSQEADERAPQAPEKRATIRGRVSRGSPELIASLEVQATALDTSTPARSGRCDAEGRFEITGLAAGTAYHLRGFVAGRASFGRSRTEVRTARPGDEIELPCLPEPVLAFQVLDARTGLPLNDFEVRLGRGFARPFLDAEGRIRRAFPDGRVRWTDWVPEEASGAVELIVSARGYHELRRGDVLAPLASVLDLGPIALEPVPRLIVHVRDAETRRGIRNALVTLECGSEGAHPPGSQAFDPYSGRTDAEGRVLLTSFPGQECLLRVQHAEHREVERPLALGLAEQQVETIDLARR